MTAIALSIMIIFHIMAFMLAGFFFYTFYKKEHYTKKELVTFISTLFGIGILGFFAANHFSFLSSDSSVLLAIGYSAFPITQIAALLLVYPVFIVIEEKYKLKFAPIFLGIIASAPFSFLLSGILTQHYWEFLGRSIYG